jgi:hypothetical protein
MRNKFNLSVPIHPFLFAIYPILSIYSANITDVFISEIISPIFISVGTTIFVFFTIKFITNDIQKSAFITSFFLVIFFSYGHIFNLIDGREIGKVVIGPNKYLVSVVFFSVSVLLIILRLKIDLQRISKFLNTVGIVLIFLSLISIGRSAISNEIKISETVSVQSNAANIERNQPVISEGYGKPDIYYIILDGYARESTLNDLYNYNNSDFINYLENSGFYVADKSQSNYSITPASLASSLNMRYLDDIAKMDATEVTKRETAIEMLRNNDVARFLKSKGYKFINLGSSWGVTTINPHADLVFRYQIRSEFTNILYQTTALILLETRDFIHADSV